jgi:hypothetical protein
MERLPDRLTRWHNPHRVSALEVVADHDPKFDSQQMRSSESDARSQFQDFASHGWFY